MLPPYPLNNHYHQLFCPYPTIVTTLSLLIHRATTVTTYSLIIPQQPPTQLPISFLFPSSDCLPPNLIFLGSISNHILFVLVVFGWEWCLLWSFGVRLVGGRYFGIKFGVGLWSGLVVNFGVWLMVGFGRWWVGWVRWFWGLASGVRMVVDFKW